MNTHKKSFELSDSLASDQVSLSSNGGNRNISDVLSQITDDGPANNSNNITHNDSRPESRNVGLHSVASNYQEGNDSNEPFSSGLHNTQGNSKASAEYAATQAAALTEKQELEEDLALSAHFLNASTNGSRSYRLIAIILFVCSCVFAYAIHDQMNTRIITLENQLLAVHDNVKPVSKSEIQQVSTKSAKKALNREITIDSLFVNETGESIKSQSEISEKTVSIAIKDLDNQPQVIALKEEVKQLQAQLNIANNRIDELDIHPVNRTMRDMNDNVVSLDIEERNLTNKPARLTKNKNTKSSNATAFKNSTNKAGKSKSDQWKVNLASFTDKQKADAVFNKLKRKSLNPSLEVADVNGKKRYRLIVNGFDKRGDAERFVKSANKEFSLSGAWIRKVS